MGTEYRHLTEQDRVFIDLMLNKGYTKIRIATILGVHRSTIHRELKRNSVKYHWRTERYYYCNMAHAAYLKRRKKLLRLEGNEPLKEYVHSKLKQGWSPWQIEGRLKSEDSKIGIITHESIYRYVYSDSDRRYLLHKYFRRKHRYRMKQGKRKFRLPKELQIASRPEEINKRLEFGHWECDLMVFKQGIKTNLITMRERKTRYMIAIKNQNKSANTTAINIISTLKNIKDHIKSITFDQGFEFSKYQWIKNTIGSDIYFCQPASPHEKGGVENGNGIIRLSFQRDHDADKLKQCEINDVINEINNRPLKCLDYRTPHELFELAINN